MGGVIMTTLKGIHKGPMTVKLVCGGIIEGVTFDSASGYLSYTAYSRTSWLSSGRHNAIVPTPFDIAEVISKPPQRTMRELFDAGELEVGMKFRSGRSAYEWITYKTTEGIWLFSSPSGSLFYQIDSMDEPDQMILQEEDK
jgi:hypothetical protein